MDTCAQQIWSLQHHMLREEFKFPQSDMVVAGLSLGWADNSLNENNMANHKLALEEFVTFAN